MEYLKIENWDKWQSYRADRGQPPWIKLHRRLMRNPEWVSLTDAERGQLVSIWLLAADHDGVIPASTDLIQKLCYMESKLNINKFIELGFICPNDAKVTPNRRQADQPEAEAEAEAEAKKNKDKKKTYQKIYDFYVSEINPKQKSKTRALKNIERWHKKHSYDDLIQAIRNYRSVCNGRDAEHKKDPANFFGVNEVFHIDYLPENFIKEENKCKTPVWY